MPNPIQRAIAFAFALSAAALVIACAGSSQKVDPLQQYAPLVRAGFELREADTPKELAVIESLPPQTVVPYTINKHLHYVYVPEGCPCAYVGTEENYNLLRQNLPENQPVNEFKIGFSSEIYFYSPGIANTSFLNRYD